VTALAKFNRFCTVNFAVLFNWFWKEDEEETWRLPA
jgi:hypothetical protein